MDDEKKQFGLRSGEEYSQINKAEIDGEIVQYDACQRNENGPIDPRESVGATRESPYTYYSEEHFQFIGVGRIHSVRGTTCVGGTKEDYLFFVKRGDKE